MPTRASPHGSCEIEQTAELSGLTMQDHRKDQLESRRHDIVQQYGYSAAGLVGT